MVLQQRPLKGSSNCTRPFIWSTVWRTSHISSTTVMRLALETSLGPGRRSCVRLGGNTSTSSSRRPGSTSRSTAVWMQPGTAFHRSSFTPAASQVMPIGWMGPPNALYGIQEKGYMDSELFLKWLHYFIRYAPEERPLILIMDQHMSQKT